MNGLDSALWLDASELPESLTESIEHAEGHAEVARAILAEPVRRLVLSGNGASWYAGNAGVLAAHETGLDLDVVSIPAGILAGGDYRWRDGDFLLAISSSGSLRDLLEVVDQPDLPRPFGLITADESSPLGLAADVIALVSVKHQRAVTHSQAYLGSTLAVLDMIAHLGGDSTLHDAVRDVPELLAGQLAQAAEWASETVSELGGFVPRAGVAFGTGPAWAAAQEAGLLLKEVSAIPTEGVETREGATTGMYALDERQMALALPYDDDDLVHEALAVCAERGARVLSAPWPAGTDRRVACAAHFLHPLALAIGLARAQDLNPDHPPWYAAYKATARLASKSEEQP